MKRLLVAVLVVMHSTSIAQINRFFDSTIFQASQRLAEVKDFKLLEISGLAASVNNPGYLWAHNDSGKKSEVYLVDDSLKILLTVSLPVIMNRDWEDIAVGPGPDPKKNYIYIGDIGDNLGIFKIKFIYRIEEPTLPKDGTKVVEVTRIARISFTVPGVPKDFETMFFDPNSKDLYVVSKREKPCHVYVLPYPQSENDTLKLSELAALQLTQLTGGSLSPDGKELLLKNYRRVFYWNNTNSKPLAELLKEEPKIIPYREESQGEAIAWARDGSGFYTVSEKIPGKRSFLFFYKKRK